MADTKEEQDFCIPAQLAISVFVNKANTISILQEDSRGEEVIITVAPHYISALVDAICAAGTEYKERISNA